VRGAALAPRLVCFCIAKGVQTGEDSTGRVGDSNRSAGSVDESSSCAPHLIVTVRRCYCWTMRLS
jgi:hypothetical protein